MWAKIDTSFSAAAVSPARWRSSNGSSRTRGWVRVFAIRFTAPSRLGAASGAARGECARHALDAVDEVRAQHLRRARDLEIRQPAHQLAKHHGDLSAREIRAETMMGARAAEADVL